MPPPGRYAPTRPLLSQPPLNIENLPSRIQKGECNVLPPKFCPPTALGCPPTACQPSCGPCCPPPMFLPPCCAPPCPPPMCCPPPCPPPMCCPPPCPPVMVCPPNFCTPYPCMPPPQCCPPPPCPPPPCQPCIPRCCTVSKPPCCGDNNSGCGGGSGRSGCCCRGPKQIVCIPRGAKPMVGGGGCGGGASRGRSSLPQAPPFKPGVDQPASYNNCNFYLTEIPKGLRDRFGIMAGAAGGSGEDECTEETEETAEESSSCKDVEEEDDECEDMINRAAGDDQCIQPPVGYPGSQRLPWGAGFPGMNNLCGGGGDPYGNRGPTRGMGGYGPGSRGPATRGPGGNGGRGRSPYGTRGRTSGTGGGPGTGRGGPGTGRGGPGTGRSTRNDYGTYNNRNLNNTPRQRTVRTMDGPSRSDRDPYPSDSPQLTTTGKTLEAKSTRQTCTSGAFFSKENMKKLNSHRSSGMRSLGAREADADPHDYRQYLYSNDELTQKPQAYLPEKYDEPPPSHFDSRIHHLRAPISNYSNKTQEGENDYGQNYPSKPASTFRTGGASSLYPSRVPTTVKGTSNRNVYPSGNGMNSTNGDPSGFQSPRNDASNATGQSLLSGVNTSRPGSSYGNNNQWDDDEDKISVYTDANVGTSRPHSTLVGRSQSEPSLRPVAEEGGEDHEEEWEGEGDNGVPIYRTATQTRLQIIERPNEPSEIRVIQRPVQEVVGFSKDDDDKPNAADSHINLDIFTEDMTQQKTHKKKVGEHDPCRPNKGCLVPHSRRLHRLCSFSNKRCQRLSQLHGPMFQFRAPPCPIRETVASIYRKKPPVNCKWHEQAIPAYHEYCMTDDRPDTNRYPLLTRENTEMALAKEGQEEGDCAPPQFGKTFKYKRNSREQERPVQKRGVKRKLHHR